MIKPGVCQAPGEKKEEEKSYNQKEKHLRLIVAL